MISTQAMPLARRPDPRIARTEAAVRTALLSLLESGRHFDSLTVSEVATSAGITRKTFYARFGSLQQVVVTIVEQLFAGIAADIDDALLRLPLVDDALAMHIFRTYAAHQQALAPLIWQCPAGLFLEPLSAVAASVLDRVVEVNRIAPMHEIERTYLAATAASILHGVISVWTRRGFSEPTERVATFLDALLSDGMQKVVLTRHP